MTVSTAIRPAAAHGPDQWEEILALVAPSRPKTPWTRVLISSTGVHVLLILLLFCLWQAAPEPELPIKVLEITVSGGHNLALKGAGTDLGLGPSNDKTLAPLPSQPGPVVAGSTSRMSASRQSKAGASSQPGPARLSASGPIFGSAAGGGPSGSGGIGREKIYVRARRPGVPGSISGAAGSGENGSEGQDLVGVSGARLDLKARRGGGTGQGSGSILGGGAGSIDGGSELRVRGEAIVADTSSIDEPIESAPRMALAPPSDEVFSIRGPLRQRRILQMSLPRYPRWAEESGVEAQVLVWLAVGADGRVKPNLYIEQTSSFPEIDRLVLEAVQNMRFAALPHDRGLEEQTGTAVFNFKLKKVARKGV
ncbi:MAG: TonB family protein [Elusimicrobia bacterium]|nr:TonB family protein [Elusimicrobiota bacterium]